MRNLQFTIISALLSFSLSVPCLAQGFGNSCDPVGVWYGGSVYQYLTVITPLEQGRFLMKSQAGFDNRQFGYVSWTDWTGEVRKTGPRSYDVTGISYWVWDPATAPSGIDTSQPELDVLHGKMEMLDCNTFRYTIDMWQAYFGFTPDRTPFVSPTDQDWLELLGVSTIVETYHRLPATDVKHEWRAGRRFNPWHAPLKNR